MGISIYTVEGAVWACLSVSWLAIRLSASRSPLDESAVVLAAALALTNFACASLSTDSKNAQRLYFQVVFAAWVSLAYQVADCLSVPALSDKYLNSPGLGHFFSVFSVAVSLALLTVQMLVAGAAVPDVLWQGTEWTDVLVALAALFQACAFHGHPQSAEYAISVLIIIMSFSILALTCVCSLVVFPLSSGIGSLSVDQILQISSISLKVVCSGFALGLAYSSGSATWALPLVLLVPVALDTMMLIFESNYRELQGEQQHEASAPPQPQPTPRPPPQIPRPRLLPRPATPQPKPEVPATASIVFARPSAAPPEQGVSAFLVTSRIDQDALLFKNTRPLVARNKKMS